jgi:hypothetical protein
VGLDANLVERLAESAYGVVGILAGKQIHLLEGTTIGFHAREASHVDDNGSDAL